MSAHLTDEQLINQQFELAESAAAQEAATHLAACAACRERLAGLQQRFAALDLLKDDVPAPDALIARVVNQAKPSANVIPFRKRTLAAIAATAAALLIGTIMHLISVRQSRVVVAKDPAIEALRATDPFIPGSNIELNVLPTRDNVQLTIYNSADLTLVRERRVLTLKKGWNWLQFMWANTLIDPTSLNLEAVSPEHRGKVEVQALVFPPRIRELGRWLLFSEVSGPVPVEITYFTSGISWRAFYMGTLATDEKTLQLQAYVRADNRSGEDYENAQTRLIVGKVNQLDRIAALARRKHAYGRPDLAHGMISWEDHGGPPGEELLDADSDGFAFGGAVGGGGGGGEPKKIIKEGLSEYFLYTIEGRETIKTGWGKRLPSFLAQDVPVESLYKYDEDRWGDRTIRFVSLANDKEHKLGETPIPNGTVRIFRKLDAEQHLNYVGAANISYIPVDEDIELELGPARDVTVEPKVMEFRAENHMFNSRGDIVGYDEVRVWRLRIANTRKLPVKVEITRNFRVSKWTLTTDEPGYEKHDITHGRFTVNLKSRTKQEIMYTLRTYHGRRAE